jgi:hypothetical protein
LFRSLILTFFNLPQPAASLTDFKNGAIVFQGQIAKGMLLAGWLPTCQ